MLIRECTADDVERLEQAVPSGLNRWHALKLERQEAGERTYLLAWYEEALAGHGEVLWQGCGSAEVRSAFPDCPEINGLLVFRPELRGRGIGTGLIGAAEDRARQRGLRWIGVGVDVDNPGASRLYERLGYVARQRYHDAWSYVDDAGAKQVVDDPGIFMVKDLPS